MYTVYVNDSKLHLNTFILVGFAIFLGILLAIPITMIVIGEFVYSHVLLLVTILLSI